MKIAVDCRMIGSGGIGSYISALLPFFTKENSCVLVGKPETLEKYRNSPHTEIVPCRVKTFSIKELLFFPKETAEKINECEVFYSPYCNVPSGIKIPVYTTIHDVVFLDVPGQASRFGTFIRRLFYKYAVIRSKAVFTVSNFSAERIKLHLGSSKPVIVTYNAVPDWFSADKESKTQKDGSILFVGNIKKHKGLRILLSAFIKARNEGLTDRLIIVGNAENFRTADNSILPEIEKAPAGSVEFTGRISDSDLKRLYMKADFLVQPSFYEGFGMPPLEAMSLGTRAVISEIPVFREIYKDFPVTFFKTGDPDDLAEKLIEASKKSQEAFDFPHKYSFKRTYKIIIETLEAAE